MRNQQALHPPRHAAVAPQALSRAAMNFPLGTFAEYRHSKEQNIPAREIYRVLCVAARGSTAAGTAVLLIATSTIRPAASTSSVSVLPEVTEM